jgi:hypothetical protein
LNESQGNTPATEPRGTPSHPQDPRVAADRLFASSTLVDLLITFCREPDRRFYVNELIRSTGRFPRSIQLALASLEGVGFISSERQANIRYYQVVREHVFFSDLASLVSKISDASSILGRALREVEGVRVAFLRPDDPESPDLELVVVCDEVARIRISSAVERVAPGLRRTIRPVFFTPDEWSRQARRDRSYVRWLLEETRSYVVGQDQDLPRP